MRRERVPPQNKKESKKEERTLLWLLLYCPFFLGHAPRSNRRSDSYGEWLKGRVSTQGSFWGSRRWVTSYGENMPQKTPQKGGGKNRQFQAKTPLCIDRNISGTISPTNKRFEDRVHTTKGTSWASAITPKQIQHGWRPPSWKSIWRHITAVGGPIWTKFGSLMQNSTPITAK